MLLYINYVYIISYVMYILICISTHKVTVVGVQTHDFIYENK